MNLAIKFKGFELVGDHIEYNIEVANASTNELWKFQRRYSVLREIYQQISHNFHTVHPFPPKKAFGNKNPKFVEQRRIELESYFIEILKMPGALDNSACKNFFTPNDKIIVPTIIINSPKPVSQNIKNPTIHMKAKEISFKVTENLPGKLFDLSTQQSALEEDEIKKQMKAYTTSCKDLMFAVENKMPKAGDNYIDCINDPVGNESFIGKALHKLNSMIPAFPATIGTKFHD